MTFGNLLKQARLDKGLTQKQLAEKINAKHNSISNWENDQNRPDPDAIEYLCGVLDVPVNYFFPSSSNKFGFSFSELEIIKKYRELDAHGKDVVDMLLDKEYSRIKDNVTTLPPKEKPSTVGIAARNGGVHMPDAEELKDMQAAHEALVLPKRKKSKGI